MRAVVPVFDRRGSSKVVALVSVGITTARIQNALADRLPTIALAAVLVLGTGLVGAWLISRRLRRQTHGMGEREITRMYEYYDAVLHAVREGLLLVDTDHRVQLLNDEAKRLLSLDQGAVGRQRNLAAGHHQVAESYGLAVGTDGGGGAGGFHDVFHAPTVPAAAAAAVAWTATVPGRSAGRLARVGAGARADGRGAGRRAA